MARAIALRDDFDAAALRQLAKNSKNGPQTRRLLSLAAIYDGATRLTMAPAKSFSVQRARPSGGLAQAVATSKASSLAVSCAPLQAAALRSAPAPDCLR